MRFYLRCGIHRAIVTEANVEYEGSITIDRQLMDDRIRVLKEAETANTIAV
jgi:aspartate 1-decarboxylase